MLIWLLGSSMVLGATVTDDETDEPVSGATVTYAIRDRAGVELAAGTLEEDPEEVGRYEDTLTIEDLYGYEVEEESLVGVMLRAKVRAELPTGVTRQSTVRLHLQHDTD